MIFEPLSKSLTESRDFVTCCSLSKAPNKSGNGLCLRVKGHKYFKQYKLGCKNRIHLVIYYSTKDLSDYQFSYESVNKIELELVLDNAKTKLEVRQRMKERVGNKA